MPLVDPGGLTLHVEYPTGIKSAFVSLGSHPTGYLSVNTAGTNIQAVYQPDGLMLTGIDDSSAVFQKVLRTLTIGGLQVEVGHTIYAQVSVTDHYGGQSAAAVSKVVVQLPGPPIIGAVDYQSVYYHGGDSVSVVSPDFSINLPLGNVLDGANVLFDSPVPAPPELFVDTSGTNIVAVYGSDGLHLTGSATVDQYVEVLRSVRFAPESTPPGTTRQVRVTVVAGSVESPPATTLVTVLWPPPPAVDLNGAAPGSGLCRDRRG